MYKIGKMYQVWTNNVMVRFFNPQADRVKVNRNDMMKKFNQAHALGFLQAIEEAYLSHKQNPYGTVDELFGDLLLMYSSAGQYLHKQDSKFIPANLEDITNEYLKVKDNV